MTTTHFSPRGDADILRLITANPLAWVVSAGASGTSASPLPLRPERVHSGRIESLTGHFPRSNPQVAQLQADPQATLLFLGPHGYVSPSWFHDRSQAPTWNFAIATFDVRIEFLDTPEDLDRIVRDLVDAMEDGRPNRWRVEDMHARYAQLLVRIIPFRATVVGVDAKFKLGQDERDDTYPEIIDGLVRGGHDALVELMNEFNAHRSVRGKTS